MFVVVICGYLVEERYVGCVGVVGVYTGSLVDGNIVLFFVDCFSIVLDGFIDRKIVEGYLG